MTHRERFLRSAQCRKADRVVFDLSGSPQTNVDSEKVRLGLGRLLGFDGPVQGEYAIDERILCALDIDTRRIGGMPTPATVHNREENGVYYDAYGIGSRLVGDHYEICYHPLKDATLDEVEAYIMPDAEKADRFWIDRWAAQAERLHRETDYAVVAEHPVLGVFELGCWMFGFDDYLYRLIAEPEVVHLFSRRVLSYQKRMIEIYYGALEDNIDCTTSGDDFGTQKSSFMSPRTFREMIMPYFKERIAYTKTFTRALYQHHTCGSVWNLLPFIIESGVDILNPIQPGAHRMEADRLKSDFGTQIAFWGGVDTQHLLPEGTTEDVRKEVYRLLDIFDGTGYILAPAHTIQKDVPAENLLEIYKAAADYYRR